MFRSILIFLVCSLFFGLTEVVAQQEFSRQDTLRGSITEERAWWDLKYYHLDLKIKPDNSFKGRSIFSRGSQIIITENCGRGNADIKKKIYFLPLHPHVSNCSVKLKARH